MRTAPKFRLLFGIPMLLLLRSTALAQSPGAPAETTFQPITVITVLLICAFATDRIVTGILAMISSRNENAARRRKLYLALAGALGVILGFVGNVRVLENLGFLHNVANSPALYLDVALTTLILTAGSDRIAVLMRRMEGKSVPSSLGKEQAEPIEITGRLTLVDERTAQVEMAAARVAQEPAKVTATAVGVGSPPPTPKP